jgi:hypothetical protein
MNFWVSRYLRHLDTTRPVPYVHLSKFIAQHCAEAVCMQMSPVDQNRDLEFRSVRECVVCVCVCVCVFERESARERERMFFHRKSPTYTVFHIMQWLSWQQNRKRNWLSWVVYYRGYRGRGGEIWKGVDVVRDKELKLEDGEASHTHVVDPVVSGVR